MLREDRQYTVPLVSEAKLQLERKPTSHIVTLFKIPKNIFLFFVRAYQAHWLACPLGALAAVVSTFSAALIVHTLAYTWMGQVERSTGIIINAILGPLFAYIIYLSVYYLGMFLKERSQLLSEDSGLDKNMLKAWFKVVKYDYLAHLPSDCYLITLASIMQAGLEANGSTTFWAIVTSQFVDDFITFLKEPAIWAGAKAVADWELRKKVA